MSRILSRARFAVLLLPALLGGCYVVPIVPVGRPYHDHGPSRGYDRGYDHGYGRGYYYRGGQADTPAPSQASASPEPKVHIEVASSSR